MLVAKFKVEKFDDMNNFWLWHIKIKVLLVQYSIDEAQEGEVTLALTLLNAKTRSIMAKTLSIMQTILSNKVIQEVCNKNLVPKLWWKLESLYMMKSLTN